MEQTLLSAAFDSDLAGKPTVVLGLPVTHRCHSDRSRSTSDGGVEEPAILPPNRTRAAATSVTVEERRFSAA